MKPISDKAEVALDFPDKLFMGSFSRGSGYETAVDAEGVMLKLARSGGEKRVVEMHLHYFLLADVLEDIARGIAARAPIDEPHRRRLSEAAAALAAALGPPLARP
jgi:hypothetical protein